MSTVPQAFHGLMVKLELTPKQEEDAEAQRRQVLQGLQGLITIKEPFISGSYGRGTATRPLHDIDLFNELEPKKYGTVESLTPDQALEKVESALKAHYPKHSPVKQNRSVNIVFTGTGIGFDVVPALRSTEDSDVYFVPDRRKGLWIPSNPRKHKDFAQAANLRARGKALALVKALKVWHRQVGKPLPNFHLEVMICELLQQDPGSYAEGAAFLFDRLRQRLNTPCDDPAGLSGYIDARVTPEERQRAANALETAHRSAQRALELDQQGDTEAAHQLWRQLFGDYYPEVGRQVAPLPQSVDKPTTRFG